MDAGVVLPLVDSIRTICANDNWIRNVETHTTLAHAVVELVCGFPTSIRAQICEKLCGQAADPLHSAPVPPVRAAPLAVQSHQDILGIEERLTESPAEFFGSSSLNVVGYLCREGKENKLIRGIAFALITRELFQCRDTWGKRSGPFKERLRSVSPGSNEPVLNTNLDKWLRCGRVFSMVAKEFGKGALIALPPEENLSTYERLPTALGNRKKSEFFKKLRDGGIEDRAKEFEILEEALSNYIFKACGSLRQELTPYITFRREPQVGPPDTIMAGHDNGLHSDGQMATAVGRSPSLPLASTGPAAPTSRQEQNSFPASAFDSVQLADGGALSLSHDDPLFRAQHPGMQYAGACSMASVEVCQPNQSADSTLGNLYDVNVWPEDRGNMPHSGIVEDAWGGNSDLADTQPRGFSSSSMCGYDISSLRPVYCEGRNAHNAHMSGYQ